MDLWLEALFSLSAAEYTIAVFFVVCGQGSTHFVSGFSEVLPPHYGDRLFLCNAANKETLAHFTKYRWPFPRKSQIQGEENLLGFLNGSQEEDYRNLLFLNINIFRIFSPLLT